MNVACPYCDVAGERGFVHRHLGEAHAEYVKVRVDERKDRRYYSIECPECRAPWEAEIKPRGRDPNFLAEYDREIKLVAFDMLLYHVQGEHMTHEQPVETAE